MMNRFAIVAVVSSALTTSALAEYREVKVEGTPFPMPALKEFVYPEKVFSIADYGAKSDGSKCTAAFAAAMAACEKAGGGRVLVPDGTWLTGPIHFGNNCELHLADNAVIEFTDDPADYLPVVNTSWEGVECRNYSPLLYGYGKRNVAITGKGTLAPRMELWRTWMGHNHAGLQVATEQLYYWCVTNAPVAARDLTKIADSNIRPQLIQFNRCENVRLEDFHIRQSPFWVIHLLHSENCIVRKIEMLAWGGNNDALDVEMTRNVLVEDCDFYGGDDGMTLKSGRNQDGWRLNRPTENVVIRRCRLRDCHGLLACGSELSGGIRNVLLEDCRGDSVGTVITLKTNRRRGGFVENVTVRNVEVEFAETVFLVNQNAIYQWAKFPDFELRPTPMRNILFENVHVRNAIKGISIASNPAAPISEVVLRNVKVYRVTNKALDGANMNGLKLDNVEFGEGGVPKSGYFFDSLANAQKYAAISPNFAKAIKFLTRPDLNQLELGKYEIDGKEVFAMVQDAKLKLPSDCKVEMHREYADIQMPLKDPKTGAYGCELIGIGPLPEGVSFPEFKPGRDVVLVKALLPFAHTYSNRFGIFLPGTPHEPGMTYGSPRTQRKICIKVRKDW